MFNWIGLVQVVVIAVMMWLFYRSFIQNTQSEKLVRGLLGLAGLWMLSFILSWVRLDLLASFLHYVALFLSLSLIVVFQATNSIMTKGVLRGGGDTKMLMLADNIFLWAASIPLGIIAGLVLHLPAFWIYFFLKIDQVLKMFWCVIRLRSGKWIKKIKTEKELA